MKNTMKVSPHGDGHYEIRVNGRPKLLHRYVWELYHGPIPAGYVIHHINGNPACNCICNLQLMSRAEHTRHHLTGVPHTPEHRMKNSLANRGKVISAEQRAKYSATTKGKPKSASNILAHTGWHHSEESKQRIREAMLRRRAKQ